MEEVFKALSIEEEGEYNVSYEKQYSHLFTNFHLTKREVGVSAKVHLLVIRHQGCEIKVANNVGDHQMGMVECHLLRGALLPEFSIENSSHYRRLFNRKANILKIDCTNPAFKKYLQEELISLELEAIARNGLFEPQIIGKATHKSFTISTYYHLAFPDKKKVLRPLMNLYKRVIDYSLNNYEGRT